MPSGPASSRYDHAHYDVSDCVYQFHHSSKHQARRASPPYGERRGRGYGKKQLMVALKPIAFLDSKFPIFLFHSTYNIIIKSICDLIPLPTMPRNLATQSAPYPRTAIRLNWRTKGSYPRTNGTDSKIPRP